MKALKIIGIVLVSLLAIVVVVGFLQPAAYHAEATIISKADPSTLYNHVNDITKRTQWSPWESMDTSMHVALGEVTEGVGASYSWESENSGTGRLEYIECVPNERVRAELYFQESGEPSIGMFIFIAVEDGTRVTWTLDGDAGSNPFLRLQFAAMQGFLEQIFLTGLTRLDSMAMEAPAMPVNTFDIQVVQREATPYLSVLDSCDMKEFATHLGMGFGKIMGHTKGQSAGMPMTIMHRFDEETMFSVFEAAIPVEGDQVGTDEIIKKELPAGPYLRGSHYGPYEAIGPLYMALEAHLAETGMELNGFPMEVYVTDPGAEPDTAKWLTHVFYPVSESGTME